MSKQEIPPQVGVEIAEAFLKGGDEKKQAIKRYLESPWGLSQQTIYRIAQEYGWESGRKVRRDKGMIRCEGVTEDDFAAVAGVAKATTRPNTGKRLASTEVIREQLILNGRPALANVSPSTLNRVLRRRGLDHEQLLSSTPAIEMRSLHPNHIHFLDASVCVQWDLRGGQRMVPRDMQKTFYKNKPGYWKEVKQVLIRWMLVDHTSGAFFVCYTYNSGETAKDVIDVLLEAWGRKPYESQYPFHGVPLMLGLDPSGANKSYPVQNLLKQLGVEPYIHASGNARASGCVETHHGLWERGFEWELLAKLAEDLDELNARARDRMIYMNAMREHSRHGKTRREKWNEIAREQLRELPDKAHCRRVATHRPEQRTPDELLRISVDNRWFQLYAPALKHRPVTVALNAWNPDALHVTTEHGEPVESKLVQTDEHGFALDAPVFGAGRYVRHSDPPAVALAKGIDQHALKDRIPGFEPKPTAHLVPPVHFLPRGGHEIALESLPASPRVRAEQVARRVRDALGLERITALQNQQLGIWLESRSDITEEELAALVAKAADAWRLPNPAAMPSYGEASQMRQDAG